MKITLQYPDTSYQGIPNVSSDVSATYGVVRLDYNQFWENYPQNISFHVSRPTRNLAPRYVKGLPATARFLVDATVVMTRDIQFWIHEMCWKRSPLMTEPQAKASWRSLMADDRFTTNFAGSTTHADYVNGTLLGSDPMKLQPMVTGGAVVKILRETVIKGTPAYEIEAIDSLGDYRQYTPEKHPHLFYQPTNSVRSEIVNINGVWTGYWKEDISDRFPQYLGNAILPIFGVGVSKNYLPKSRISILGVGESFPSPFTR